MQRTPSIQIRPILAALRRHKAGTILIALQIALTLAIVCNALFIIEQRITRMSRPTGLIESDLLTVQSNWVGVDADTTTPLARADLLALRQLPGVQDATLTNSYPIRGGAWTTDVRIDPNAKSGMATVTQYFTDDHALPSMGLKLLAGRNFRSDEIGSASRDSYTPPPVAIISAALNGKLYPDGSALGKQIYLGMKPSTVIGIVERLQGGETDTDSDTYADYTVLLPIQLTNYANSYLIRARPGQLANITRTVPQLLYKLNRMRLIPEKRGLRTFDAVRTQAYRRDRGMAILMSAICVILLAITAAGIVGLTSFWVGQRRKQIGVRRALGATRADILSYFLTENLLISVGGVLLGAVLAIALNLWLGQLFELARLSLSYVLVGVVVLLLLGQGAVLAPALRASRVSPVEATRSV